MGLLIVIASIIIFYVYAYIHAIQNAMEKEKQNNIQYIATIKEFSDNPQRLPSSLNERNQIYLYIIKICNLINTEKRNYIQKIAELEKHNNDLCSLLEQFNNNINEGMKTLSEFHSDLKTLIFHHSSEYLKHKSHPAPVEARRIDALRKEVRENIDLKKQMQYKYEYLLHLFPELESYIDDLSSLNEYKNKLDDFKDDYDEVLKYISWSEYKKLPENERNQLALDNYINSTKKSKWDIGRDYEMYCSYCFEKLGFCCEQVGIELKLKDLGRDIIASKDNDIYIIQCKYWSQEKIIHEKHIAQLYGTAMQYKLENLKKIEENNINVIPYFVTNIKLSETAKKFAEYLNVEYQENFELKEFPRIKCNNNYDEYGLPTKIYHLPMDQQYEKTKITAKNGDSYAYTVEEAVNKGYRRARKHFY